MLCGCVYMCLPLCTKSGVIPRDYPSVLFHLGARVCVCVSQIKFFAPVFLQCKRGNLAETEGEKNRKKEKVRRWHTAASPFVITLSGPY